MIDGCIVLYLKLWLNYGIISGNWQTDGPFRCYTMLYEYRIKNAAVNEWKRSGKKQGLPYEKQY